MLVRVVLGVVPRAVQLFVDTGKTIEPKVGLPSEIDDLIERYYGQGRSAMGTIVENLSDEATRSEDDIEHLRDLASEAPVIRLVNLVIQRAVEQRASDIHVEPFENRLKVRYRIDGVLIEVESPPAASISRLGSACATPSCISQTLLRPLFPSMSVSRCTKAR